MKKLNWALVAVAFVSGQAMAIDAKRYDITDPADMGVMGCTPAVADDFADDTKSFVCAMAFFSGFKKDRPNLGVLHVPAGEYTLSDVVKVPYGVQIVGDGLSTVLKQDTLGAQVSLFELGERTILRDFEIDQLQAKPAANYAPFKYPYAIVAKSNDTLIENISFKKVYAGIYVGGSSGNFLAKRVTLRNIRGQPLFVGIELDAAADARLEDIEFSNSWSELEPDGKFVEEYMRTGGTTGILSRYATNPMMTNLTLNYLTIALQFDKGVAVAASTSGAKVSGLSVGSGSTGIFVAGNSAKDNVVHGYTYVGAVGFNTLDRLPLRVSGSDSSISVTEADIDYAVGAAAYVIADRTFVRCQGWKVRRWNDGGTFGFAFWVFGSNTKVWVKDSYGRWGNGTGPACSGTQSCEFALGQTL